MNEPLVPSFRDIQAARERLSGHAHFTPVLTSRTLDRFAEAEVLFKCENFQLGGAFKFRGAYNAISQLAAEQKRRGVMTYSSGNHAQAVALVSQLLGVRATVVMPKNAPVVKRAATAGYGARIVEHDPARTTREQVAKAIAQEEGQIVIPPFDHPHVIAGQGTVAAEFIDQAKPLDLLLVPCGGGGLLSGCALAAKHLQPPCRVIGVEPELADDATRSFHSKTLQTVQNPPTIADGTRTASLGQFTFPLVLECVDEMLTVTEQAIIEAVRFLFFRMKLVVEPSGALGLAAVLSGRIHCPGRRLGIVLSGGNLDGETAAKILGSISEPAPD